MEQNVFQRIAIGVATPLIVAAVLAGASGLITARTTKADVAAMQKEITAQRELTAEISKSVTKLETNVGMMRDEDKTLREEYREDQKELHRKLDRLLQSR